MGGNSGEIGGGGIGGRNWGGGIRGKLLNFGEIGGGGFWESWGKIGELCLPNGSEQKEQTNRENMPFIFHLHLTS